jgi:hypothetical protein
MTSDDEEKLKLKDKTRVSDFLMIVESDDLKEVLTNWMNSIPDREAPAVTTSITSMTSRKDRLKKVQESKQKSKQQAATDTLATTCTAKGDNEGDEPASNEILSNKENDKKPVAKKATAVKTTMTRAQVLRKMSKRLK